MVRRVGPPRLNETQRFSIAANRFGHFDDIKTSHYLSIGQFDLLVALAFPNADIGRLETCFRFLLWAFSVSVLSW